MDRITKSLVIVALHALLVFTKADNPFSQLVNNILPSCIFGIDSVQFVLFTRSYPEGIKIDYNETYIPINPNASTKFIVHGFISEANNSNFNDLANTWLDEEDTNIFSLDWQEDACNTGMTLTDLLGYPSAVDNTKAVGIYMAQFIKKLKDLYDVIVRNIIMVGHSLGAHVSGFAGKELQKLGLGKCKMIVGLDAAGPGFENANCENRLCETDAAFVQTFHTSQVFGIHQSVGCVDFYFNGQAYQPGCILPDCTHTRAIIYFINSLLPKCLFIGTPWTRGTTNRFNLGNCTKDVCTVAGLEAPEYPARGTFYVRTTSTDPYCTVLTG